MSPISVVTDFSVHTGGERLRLKSFSVENVRSYGKVESLTTTEPISLIIGPNGGGKTNLFDALATVVRRFIIAGRSIAGSQPQDGRPMRELQTNNEVQNLQLEKHNLLLDQDQEIVLDIEVTASDVQAMETIFVSREKMADVASDIRGWNYKFCLDWSEDLPSKRSSSKGSRKTDLPNGAGGILDESSNDGSARG